MRSNAQCPVLSVGELLWDILPAGRRLGGTTTNFAILTSRLGDYVSPVSRIGDDELGRQAMAQLQAVAERPGVHGHFDLSGIQVSPDLPTGTVNVTLDSDGRPKYTIVEPSAWDQIQPEDGLMARAETASAICFGTLAQRRHPSRETLRALVQTAPSSCVRVCDVNLRVPFCDSETLRWCIEHATVLKISDEELPTAAQLLGLDDLIAEPDHGGAANQLTEWATEAASLMLELSPSCRMVAITLGPYGGVLTTRAESHRHPGIPVNVVDTIGAGDAFTAGMVHAYTRGASLEQINAISNLCGSYVASRSGATPELPQSLLDAIDNALASS